MDMSINDSNSVLLAVDVGGTFTRGALVRIFDHRILARAKLETHIGDVQGLLRDLKALSEKLEHRVTTAPVAAGIALACPVDPQKNITGFSQKLGLESGTNLIALLQDALSLPSFVHTELSMAALGEHTCGLGQGHSSVVVLTVGTGVGAGVIANNQLLLGATGSAGEIAHIPVAFSNDARPCLCGRRGCLEAYANARSVTFRDGQRSDLTPRQVVKSAQAGKTVALEALRVTGNYIGLAIAICINAYNPELIVLRGGFIRAVWPLVSNEALNIVTNMSLAPDTPVKLSPLRDDGVFLGLVVRWRALYQGLKPTHLQTPLLRETSS